MKLVSNCSPLIFLAKLNFLELLSGDRLLVPSEVQEELLRKESVEKDKIQRFLSEKNVAVLKVKKSRDFSEALGKGEMATINLALEKKITNVLMDDRRARSLAKIHKLRPRGTLWIILRAYKNGVINKSQAREIIYELPSVGFRVDMEFLFQILKTL